MYNKKVLIPIYIMVFIIAGIAYATPPTGPHPFNQDIKPESVFKSGSPMNLIFSIKLDEFLFQNKNISEVKVEIVEIRNMQYDGEMIWSATIDENEEYSRIFEVTIPKNDTSGIVMNLEGGGFTENIKLFFICDGNEVKWLHGDPRLYTPYKSTTAEEWEEIHRQELAEQREEEQKKRELEKSYEKVTIIDGDEIFPEDSALYKSLSERGKKALKRMRYLERHPMAGAPGVRISLDGVIYQRGGRDNKFEKMEFITNTSEHAMNLRDSVRTSSGYVFDILLDLRSTDNIEYVKNLVDSLYPTEIDGVYKIHEKWEIFMQLRGNGIKEYQKKK
ncbi:MAG: hypothetical protein ACT6FE_05185 [Methanosarcinaceae archaeon]